MRTALAALLTALALPLAACDSGNDAPTIRVTEPPTAQLVAERDSLVVDLATVFQSDDGSLNFAIVSAPAGAAIRNGSRLVVPPQPPGAVQAELRAFLSASVSARATLHATFAYAGKIAAVKAFEPLALDARKDSAVYDLSTYFAVPPGVTVIYTASGGGTSVSGSTLKVKPMEGGTSNVEVRASAPGIEAATATLALTAKSNWCATAPTRTVDPIPYAAGETVRFQLRVYAGGTLQRKGTLTWTFQERTCLYGGSSLRFSERIQATDSTNTGLKTVDITQTHTVSIPSTGTLPQMGQYAFISPQGNAINIPASPRYLSAQASGQGTYTWAAGSSWGSGSLDISASDHG